MFVHFLQVTHVIWLLSSIVWFCLYCFKSMNQPLTVLCFVIPNYIIVNLTVCIVIIVEGVWTGDIQLLTSLDIGSFFFLKLSRLLSYHTLLFLARILNHIRKVCPSLSIHKLVISTTLPNWLMSFCFGTDYDNSTNPFKR